MSYHNTDLETLVYHTTWEASDHTILMAVENGLPIGVAQVQYGNVSRDHTDKDWALLWNLQVDKHDRHKGVGQILLNHAIGLAIARGCTEMRLVWRHVDTPRWVIKWYNRNGFDECAFWDGGIEMRKQLINNEQ